MFLRKVCRRILILHSYRDGRGKVCQRRLGHFSDPAGMEREFQELPRRCPDLSCDLARLRGRARELMSLGQTPSANSTEGARKALQRLLEWLAENPEGQGLEVELASLKARLEELPLPEEAKATALRSSRSALPARRLRFDASDPKAQPYLQELDRLAQAAEQRGQPEDQVRFLQERVKACPDSQALLRYGVLLHKLGRHQEAIDQYQRLPDHEGVRHYNLGLLRWQIGDFEQALVHLLRGMARQPETAEALLRHSQGKPMRVGADYWQEYGELWDGLSRKFFLNIAGQHLVKQRMRRVRASGTRVRNLVPPSSRVWLLERALREWGPGPSAVSLRTLPDSRSGISGLSFSGQMSP